MNANNVYCAGPNHSVSCMSGDGIPAGCVEFHTSRVFRLPGGRLKFLKTSHYGEVMSRAEYERINRESGYTVQHGRNTGNFYGFVQSRAARRRGYKPTGTAARRYEEARRIHERARAAK